MTKTLQSILNKVPPATVDNPAFINPESKVERDKLQKFESKEAEPSYRIVAEIPRSVKIQIKERLSKNPEETERTIILKALRAIGINIKDEDLIDQRKNKRNRM